jgi:hypothetical protein
VILRHSVVTDITKIGGLVRGFRVSLFGEATRVLEKADRDRGLICFACGIAIPRGMKYYCFSQCLMAARELVYVVACEECSEVLKAAINACSEKRTQCATADRGIGDAGSVPPTPGGVRADQEAHPEAVQAP